MDGEKGKKVWELWNEVNLAGVPGWEGRLKSRFLPKTRHLLLRVWILWWATEKYYSGLGQGLPWLSLNFKYAVKFCFSIPHYIFKNSSMFSCLKQLYFFPLY